MSSGLKKHFIAFLLLIVGASIYSSTQPYPLIFDSIEYQFAAQNFYEHNVLYSGDLMQEVDYRLYSKRTPGYPIFQIYNWNLSWLVILAQSLLLVLCFFAGLDVLKSLKSNTLSYKIYSWLMLLSPVLIIHSQLILADLVLMTSVTVLISILITSKLDLRTRCLLLSLLMIIAVLVKPVMMPALAFFVIAFVYVLIRHKRFIPSLLAPIVVVIGVSLLNKNFSGVSEYSSISTINIAQYNAKLTIANAYGFDSAQAFTSSNIYQIPRDDQQYKMYKNNLQEAGKSAIIENLGAYLKVHIIGSVKMILDPGRYELYTYSGAPTAERSLTELLYARQWNELANAMWSKPVLSILFVLLLIINILKVIGGLFIFKNITKNHWIIIATCIYFVGITGPIGAARFFIPCLILFSILSAEGWSRLLNTFQKSSKG